MRNSRRKSSFVARISSRTSRTSTSPSRSAHFLERQNYSALIHDSSEVPLGLIQLCRC